MFRSLIICLSLLTLADDAAPPTVTLTPEQEERMARRAAELLWNAVHEVLSPSLPPVTPTPTTPAPETPPPVTQPPVTTPPVTTPPVTQPPVTPPVTTPPTTPPPVTIPTPENPPVTQPPVTTPPVTTPPVTQPPVTPPVTTPPVTPTPAPEVRYLDDGDPGFVTDRNGRGWIHWDGQKAYNNDVLEGTDPKKNMAAWIFAVPAGTYKVGVSWVPWDNRQQQARYAVFAGSNLIGQVTVDQRKAPTGLTDKGLNWQPLGTFAVPAGNLEVHLTGQGAGTSLIADAVRLETVPPSGLSTSSLSPTLIPNAVEPVLPRPRLATSRIGPSGATLIAVAVDPDGAPLEISDGVPVTLTVAGKPLKVAAPVVGSGEGRAPYAVFPLAAPVAKGSTVALDAPAGWLMTALGPLPAAAVVVVDTSGVGTPLLPQEPPTVPRNLKVDWNTAAPTYFSPIITNTDMMKGASAWTSNGSPTLDADDWPTATKGGPTFCTGLVSVSSPFDPRRYANAPFGRWTVDWVGSGSVTLSCDENTQLVEAGFDAGKRRRIYDVTSRAKALNAPVLYVNAEGACAQIRLLPPGVDPAITPHFHPEYLRMLAGSGSLRAMGPLGIIGSSIVDYADFPRTTQRSYADPPRPSRNIAVAKIEDASAQMPYFVGSRLLVRVTTAVPHGLTEGRGVSLYGPITLKLADGTWNANGAYSPISHVTPTQFNMVFWMGRQSVVAEPYTGEGTVWVPSGTSGQPPAEHVALCNVVGADCWMNVPHTASDQCVRDLLTMVGRQLKPGLKIRVELSNEHWNYYFPEWGFYFIRGQSATPPLSTSQAYAQHTAHVHDIAAEILTSLGRGADLIRVYGSQAVNPGVTGDMVTWCAAHGAKIDELAISPYYGNGPAAVRDDLTPDQIMDLGELWIRSKGAVDALVGWHSDALKAHFPDAKVVAYEGGPCYGQIGGTTDEITMRQSVAWLHHPRHRGILLEHLRQCEAKGMTQYHMYAITAVISGESVGSLYSAYHRWDMPAGRGDGGDGLFDNRTGLYDLSKVVSVVGGAVNRWNGVAPAPSVTPAP
jgi:hypothetical protein